MDKLGFTPAKNFLAEWVAECQVTDAFSLIHKANLSVHSANEDVLHGLYTILPQMISSKLHRERERERANCTSGGVSVPCIYLHAR